MNETHTLVTGGTGFVGRRLVSNLVGDHQVVRILTREASRGRGFQEGSVAFVTGDLTRPMELAGVCENVETVFHLAGYAHDVSSNAAEMHWQTTVEGTRALLAESVRAGVRRFMFLSSVKAMGEGGDDCLDETPPTQPTSAYGRARREAERLVLAAGGDYDMHVCVLRLPLVYGPGSKGNIPRMIAAIDRGRFPPLAETGNRRSMVHVDDVVQALLLGAKSPAANGQVYIVTDEQVYSTRAIYVAICRALGRRVPTWSVPAWLLRGAAHIGDALERVTRHTMPLTQTTFEKLIGSAWYSSARIRRELGYQPRHSLFDVLPEMIAEHQAEAQPTMSSAG